MLKNKYVRSNKYIFYCSYKTIRRISDPPINNYFNAIRLLKRDVDHMIDLHKNIYDKIFKQIGGTYAKTYANSIPESVYSANAYFDICYGLRKRFYAAYSDLSLPEDEYRRKKIVRHIEVEESFTLNCESLFEIKKIFIVAVLFSNNGNIKIIGKI